MIPREIQLDPVKDLPLHVDFQRVGAGARIRVNVPVRFINEGLSPGLKRGGVLNIVRHEVEVTCPADAIPEYFEFNLEGLEIGRSIHISAIKMPEGVKPTILNRDFTVATVAGHKIEEEPTPGAEVAVAEGAVPAEGEEGAPAAEAADAKAPPARRPRAAKAPAGKEAALRSQPRPSPPPRARNRRRGRLVQPRCEREPSMKLFVGLGNPGSEYARHRHNVGFMAVERIAERHGLGPWKKRFHGLACEGPIGGQARDAAEAADLHERQRPLGRRGAALSQDRARATSTSSTTSSISRPPSSR